MCGFVFAFIYVSTNLLGNVVHAPNLDVLEKHIQELDENALVVFDVDFTLIVPDDRILAPCGEAHLKKFRNRHRELVEDWEVLESKVCLKAQVSLIDNRILNLLERLKQKKIKVMALTAMPTGRLGLVPNAEAWRVQQLAALGIHFGWSFPDIDSMALEGFAGKKTRPVFKRGILLSAKYPKGKVLCAFLKKVGWQPSQVFFIDDRMEYIDSVECELEKEHIKHTSFHYTAATDAPCQLDEKLADFQLNYLLERGEWLSEEEANRVDGIQNEIKVLMDHASHHSR